MDTNISVQLIQIFPYHLWFDFSLFLSLFFLHFYYSRMNPPCSSSLAHLLNSKLP